MSSCLPAHGRVDCSLCHGGRPISFDRTKREEDGWRITANPLSWGSVNAEVVILGFSKGPTQSGALERSPHDEIAYKGSRKAVGKILAHVGLLPPTPAEKLSATVDQLIADHNGRFHFGSLIRCTVERQDPQDGTWKGSGGGMLDKFIGTPFGREVASNCARRFLADLPPRTKLVLMFGLGTKGNYVAAARKLFQAARPGAWKTVNEVAYTDDQVTVVHVEHFASQGALLPNWLGENQHPRAQLGKLAREAVAAALG